jgi:integrase
MYKNGKWWYTSISYENRKIIRSLKTTDKREAKLREKKIHREIYSQLVTGKYDDRKQPPELQKRIDLFLNTKKLSTRRTYFYILNKILPREDKFDNITFATEMSYKRHINAFYNFCNKTYQCNYKTYKIQEPKGRTRVYSEEELIKLKTLSLDLTFRNFINFAYYTGARRSELINILEKQEGFMWVRGKGGKRMVKLFKNAEPFFDYYPYSEDKITKEFKAQARRLEIKDARFHDLRRTFGLNYLRKGGTIHELSKLLGDTLRITERHYAPLLVMQIPDIEF